MRAWLMTLGLLMAGCGGHGGSPTGNDGGTAIGESDRLATIAAADATFQAGIGAPKDQRDAALVTFFQGQKTVEAAGTSPLGNVWVRFTDGSLYLDLDNTDLPATPPHRPKSAEPRAAPGTAVSDMPEQVAAVAVSSLEPGQMPDDKGIADMLANAGYQVQRGSLDVDGLLALSNVGVLYWQTRAGQGTLRSTSDPPPTTYALMTTTVASADLGQGRYKALRDQGELALVGVNIQESGKWRKEIRYGATEKLIASLQKPLASTALVIIDAATSADSGMEAAWAAAGAAHYLGWSGAAPVDGFAFQIFFDRMLGVDQVVNVTPALRPFTSQAVESWMQQGGYDQNRFSSSVKVRLFYHPQNGDFAILTPTIQRVLNTSRGSDGKWRWTVEGNFGDAPGAGAHSVTYGGTPLDILSWTSTSILVQVPNQVPSGEMQVAVGVRKSETVPITEWKIPFTYTLIGKGTLKQVIHVDCHLRADIRGIRNGPGDLFPSWIPIQTWALYDTSGQLDASGTYTDPGGTTTTWSGGGILPWTGDPASTATNFVQCQGAIAITPSTAPLSIDQASLQYFTLIASGNYSGGHAIDLGSLQGIALPMTLQMDPATFRIQAGKIPATGSLGSLGVSATLEWPETDASYVPGDLDAR